MTKCWAVILFGAVGSDEEDTASTATPLRSAQMTKFGVYYILRVFVPAWEVRELPCPASDVASTYPIAAARCVVYNKGEKLRPTTTLKFKKTGD